MVVVVVLVVVNGVVVVTVSQSCTTTPFKNCRAFVVKCKDEMSTTVVVHVVGRDHRSVDATKHPHLYVYFEPKIRLLLLQHHWRATAVVICPHQDFHANTGQV